jgi:quercetin dioxygenase-like cupin family protein
MSRQSVVTTPKDRPAALKIVGEEITVLAAGAKTESYEIFFHAGPEGSGPPPHSHPWDEAFYILRGPVAFMLDGVDHIAESGTLVSVAGGTPHAFRYLDGGGEMLGLTSRPGAAEMFTEMDRDLAPEAPDLAVLVAIAAAHETKIAVPAN